MRIAFLTAACMQEGHPARREDYGEHDREFAPLRTACTARRMELVAEVWDDPRFRAEAYDAVVIGTTWDYAERPGAFLSALGRLAAERPLWNPLPLVRWNLEKTYLLDLAGRGVPVVPTLWRDSASPEVLARAFEDLGVDEIVVKPVVGASAWRQARLVRGGPVPPATDLPPGGALLQPFLHAAAEEGEYSFVFLGGSFSHCARKTAREGDYRVQSMYGGRETAHAPSAGDLALARRAVEAIPGDALYARVDMMRGADGGLVLMELELIEPYLYPDQGPGMGERFARALWERVRHQGKLR